MKKHPNNVEKLRQLEVELITLIAFQDNTELNDKFIEWQKMRNICNESSVNYFEYLIDEALKEKKNK